MMHCLYDTQIDKLHGTCLVNPFATGGTLKGRILFFSMEIVVIKYELYLLARLIVDYFVLHSLSVIKI